MISETRTDQRHLFVSPHLDDAAFACGAWIARAARPCVVTIFAGPPPRGASLTAWDSECGFRDGDDVLALRREEDRAALALLGATPVWLGFRDDQYGEPRGNAEIAHALGEVLDAQDVDAIHCPLGLFHADHRRAADASLALFARFASLAWYVYEDAIYRRIPGAVEERMALLRERGFALVRCARQPDRFAHARKREAIGCYRSQLRALGTRKAAEDVFADEAHWSLAAAGAAA